MKQKIWFVILFIIVSGTIVAGVSMYFFPEWGLTTRGVVVLVVGAIVSVIAVLSNLAQIIDFIRRLIEKPLPVTTPDPDKILEWIEKNYDGFRKEIIHDYEVFWKQTVIGLGQDNDSLTDRIPVPIGQVFSIDITASQDKTQSSGKNPPSDFETNPKDPNSVTNRVDNQKIYYDLLTLFLTNDLQHVALLIGGPGSGKTLALRYLAAKFADQLQGTKDILPIFLPLNQYEPGEKIGDFIGRILRQSAKNAYHSKLADNLDLLLEGNYSIFMLFDGLNEIASFSSREHRLKFLEQIFIFSQSYPHVRCLVSTRESTDRPNDNLPSIFIQPLNQIHIRKFIELFFPTSRTEIIAQINKNPDLQKMASNPFYLRVICQIFQTFPSKDFPKNPGTLLRTYINELEQRINEHNKKSMEYQAKNHSWQSMLSKIAKNQITENTRFSSVKDLGRGILGRSYKHLELPESLGIIYIKEGRIQFLQDQLLEYFGACWLLETIQTEGYEADDITEALHSSAWDESFYLLIGLIPMFPEIDVDGLISKIALVDPFLAARCAATVPDQISENFRHWFSEYLKSCLWEAIIINNSELIKQLLIAIKNIHWSECLEFLIDSDIFGGAQRVLNNIFSNNNDFLTLYLQAIASIDTTKAFEFLHRKLNELNESEYRVTTEEKDAYINAIICMTTPEASVFISEHIFDKRYYEAIVKAIRSNRLHNFDKCLHELLIGTNLMVDGSTKFDMVAEAIGQTGMISLIPVLLLFRDRPSAFKSLLLLDAGQLVIDDFVMQWKFTMRLLDNKFDPSSDFLDDNSFIYRNSDLGKNRYMQLAYTWTSILRSLGQEAIEEYYDLLIHCVEESKDLSAVTYAADALSFFKVKRAIPTIKYRDEKEFPDPSSQIETQERTLHIRLLEIIEKLETPSISNTTKNPLEIFILETLKQGWNEFEGKSLPLNQLKRIKLGYKEPDLVKKMAIEVVFVRINSDPPSSYYLSTIYPAAIKYLTEIDSKLASRALITLLNYIQNSDTYYGSFQAWKVCTLFIDFGQKGEAQRLEAIKQLTPLALGNDQQLQLIAIDILAELNVSEICRDLLIFLSDQTWITAYAIVGAIQRLNPDNNTYHILLARLNSPNDSDRYFAALAIGELKRDGCEHELMKLKDDPNVFVRRAMLSALAKSGKKTEEIIKLVSLYLSFESEVSGWVRIEAAYTVGCLKIEELANQLIDCLDDPDLRVVEQAVVALGKLRFEQSVPRLIKLIRNFSGIREYTYYDEYEMKMRPEMRLRWLASTQIAHMHKQISSEIFVNKQGSKGEDLFKERPKEAQEEAIPEIGYLLEGQMNRGLFSPDEEAKVSTIPIKIPILAVPDSEFVNKSIEELDSVRKSSPDPDKRAMAFIEYASRLEDKLIEEEEMFYRLEEEDHDPSLSVQFARHWWRFKYFINHQNEFQRPPKVLTDLPLINFAILQELKNQAPHAIIDHLQGSTSHTQEWEDPVLELVSLFPDDYDIREFKLVLQEFLQKSCLDHYYGYAELETAFIKTLTYLADDSEINFILRTIPVLIGSSITNEMQIFEPLVSQRNWNVVPLLSSLFVKALSKHNEYDDSLEHLLSLGVYQSYNLIPRNSRGKDYSNKGSGIPLIHKLRMQIELKNSQPLSLGDRLYKIFSPNDMGSSYRYIYSDLLCEVDTQIAPDDWVELQAISLGNNYGDPDCLGRGLRKWGVQALLAVFGRRSEIEGNTLPEICRSLIKTEDSGNWESNVLRSNERQAILQVVEHCTEGELAEWLDSNKFGVRLLAICLLVQRKSKLLDSLIGKIIQDPHSSVLLTIFELSQEGYFPQFWDVMNGRGEKDRQEYQLILDAIRKQIHSDDPEEIVVWEEVIGSYEFTELTNELISLLDNPSAKIVSTALQAIREFGTLSASDEIILQKLGTEDPVELVSILETILALGYEIKEERLLGWLSHPDLKVVRIATLIYGLQGLNSSTSVLDSLNEKYIKEALKLQQREYGQIYRLIPTEGDAI